MEARKRSCPSIQEARKKSRRSILNKNMGINLPDDVIVEILSQLPVKSVLRFKCVCKSWLIITQQNFFIKKHQISLNHIVYEYEQIYEDKFNVRYLHGDSLNGLVLETNLKTRLHRIRNPATKQVLQVTSQVFERNFKYIIGFDPSTSLYKIVNFYIKEETDDIGVRILTIGSDDDHGWRYLDNINLSWVKYTDPCHIYHKDVSYTATYSYKELEKTDILRLPMDEKKSSMNIKVPLSFQTVPGIKSNNPLQMFILGDEKLSIGFIIGHNLHVWVLDNYEKHIWSEEKIIPLNFIEYIPYRFTIIVQPSPNLGKLHVTFGNYYVIYDVHSKSVICLLAELPRGECFLYNITPSLASLKGMRSEHP